MLQLQRPQPMPHALALDRPPHSSSYSSIKTTRPQPEQSSQRNPYPSIASIYASERSQARPSLGNPVTPPTDMTSIHGGHNALLQNGNYRIQRVGGHELPEAKLPMAGSRQSTYYNNASQSTYRPTAAPPSPNTMVTEDFHRRASNHAIAPSLQVPSSINTPQTSMPQLAAEITCLFWFENSSTLHRALDSRSPSLPVSSLVPDAQPTTGFRKWVATILSTTQVTQNVVLLALLFIYRLKTINPGVKGKPGSEYRLLTVALMLGNKFLDDNTYTNKTWADVSGISVQEVHIMEVEFLSNMKYNLFTSAEKWNDWHKTLGKFGTFFEKASRAALDVPPRPVGPPTPTLHVPPNLPSPPNSTQASPPFLNSYSPNHSYSTTPTILPQIGSTVVSPIGPLPELNLRPGSRKRSYDDQAQEPAPKRTLTNFSQTTDSRDSYPAYSGGLQQPASLTTSVPMLPPLPNLSVPQLPPPAGRAMSLVYPPPVQWPQSSSAPPAAAPTVSLSQPQSNGSNVPSRQLSPYAAGSASNSPVNGSYGAPSAQKQNRLSPSFYLSQRSSPYRPVRGVNTLLVPPPSSSMSHPPRLGFDQMQYQPLGRPFNERRVGPLPYMNHDAWPTTNQFNQWPVLPQPNFSR